MKDDLFPTHQTPSGDLAIVGHQAQLDAAFSWLKALLQSVHGPEEGERMVKEIPMLVGLIMYRAVMYHAPEA